MGGKTRPKYRLQRSQVRFNDPTELWMAVATITKEVGELVGQFGHLSSDTTEYLRLKVDPMAWMDLKIPGTAKTNGICPRIDYLIYRIRQTNMPS